MKQYTIATALLTIASILAAGNAQLIPFYNLPRPSPSAQSRLEVSSPLPNNNLSPFPATDQRPLVQMSQPSPSSPGDANPNHPKPNTAVILSDVLGAQERINIFAGFTRDVNSVSSRLENPLLNTTVLAPLNSAVTVLPRKPWEDPADYESMGVRAYKGDEGRNRAYANLERFTQAHVVPASPWKEGEKVGREQGGEVWWETGKDGKVRVMPGEVEVEGVVSRVGNGEVWVLKGVLNYEVQ